MEDYIPHPRSAQGKGYDIVATILIMLTFGVTSLFGGIVGTALFLVNWEVLSSRDLIFYGLLAFTWFLATFGTYLVISCFSDIKKTFHLYKAKLFQPSVKWHWDALWDTSCTPSTTTLSHTWHKTIIFMLYPGMLAILGFILYVNTKDQPLIVTLEIFLVIVNVTHYVWYRNKKNEKQILCYYPDFPLFLKSRTDVEIKNLKHFDDTDIKLHYVRETSHSKTYYVNDKRRTYTVTKHHNDYTKEIEGKVYNDILRIPLDLRSIPQDENELEESTPKFWELEVISKGSGEKHFFILPIYKPLDAA